MVWIRRARVAGTPKNLLPRIADEEMEGEQVVLDGFFISIFPYPNEEAAIPLASVTQEQAKGLCEKRGQRLCTELEWERACKGPDNHIYEYGYHYRADICGTESAHAPVGLRLGAATSCARHARLALGMDRELVEQENKGGAGRRARRQQSRGSSRAAARTAPAGRRRRRRRPWASAVAPDPRTIPR
jgi:hypothetical protein